MAGDITRSTFRKENHYSQVCQQQGRVGLDADFNEQGKIDRHWDITANKDIIGPCGFPRDNAGFEIAVVPGENGNPSTLSIAPGRGYVDGILIENEESVLFTQQLDLPGAILPEETGTHIVYLDVWERDLTPIQAPHIQEVALNGADTTTRKKIVWQAKLLRVSPFDPSPSLELLNRVANLLAELISQQSGIPGPVIALNIRRQRLLGRILDFREGFLDLPVESRLGELRSFLIDIQGSLPSLSIVNPELQAAIDTELERLDSPLILASCSSDFPEWDDLIVPSTGRLNARTQPEEQEDNLCLIPPSAGYQQLENQLYRVEVHTVNEDGTIAVKWSRENASVVTKVNEIDGNTINVESLGRDENLGFLTNQWAEINSDRSDLIQQFGQLIQIQTDPDRREITILSQPFTLSDVFGDLDVGDRPYLRRWDQSGTATEAGVSVEFDGWLNLEAGIQILFEEGTYQPGDYWLIPARTATGGIEWPRDENDNHIPQLPEGIHHHYCRLALIQIEEGSEITLLEDCRRLFPPLTESPGASPVANAIHVTDINWNHDNYLHVTLLRPPLIITLDSTPLPSTLTPQTVEVTVHRSIGTVPALVEDLIFVVDGEISSESNTIQWRLLDDQLARLQSLLREPQGQVRPPFSVPMYVTIRGHKIWNAGGLYLDGQVFGQPPDETGQGIRLPSGDNQRASTFESWFYVTGALLVLTIQSPVEGGQETTGTITSETLAQPSRDITIRLTSSNTRAARVPPTITIPAGNTTAVFTVETSNNIEPTTTVDGRSAVQVEITAEFAGMLATGELTVFIPVLI